MADERQAPSTDSGTPVDPGVAPGVTPSSPASEPPELRWTVAAEVETPRVAQPQPSFNGRLMYQPAPQQWPGQPAWPRPAQTPAAWPGQPAWPPQPQAAWPQPAWPQPAWPAPAGRPAWGTAAAWPVGFVPWGYTNPPPVPPSLDPPGAFHPEVSRRRFWSLRGRRSPRLYLFGLLVGGPAIAALLFLEIGLRAGLSLKHLAIPGEALVLAVCLATILGLGAAAFAQAGQRRADGWRDYIGPAPLIVAGMLLATIEGLTLVLEMILGDSQNVDGTAAFLLKIGMYLVSYVTLVHLMAVRTGAITWHDIIWPRHMAPTMDQLKPDAEPAPEFDPWGRPTRSLRSRISGGVIGDVLLALAMLIPLVILSNITQRLLLAILGLNAYDLSTPVPTSAQITDPWIALLAIAVMTPIGEEVFFRGLVTNAWGRSLSRSGTLIRGALFFAAIHMINVTTTNADISFRAAIFNMGARIPIAIAITWLYMRRRSMFASGAMHAFYNGLLVIVTFL